MTKITLDHLSDRELLVLTAQGVNETRAQLTKQNGRIRKLEDWRNVLAGGLGLLAVLTPILIFVANRIA